ncbi:hypothetical protein [Streptomyces sp. NPDC020951]
MAHERVERQLTGRLDGRIFVGSSLTTTTEVENFPTSPTETMARACF